MNTLKRSGDFVVSLVVVAEQAVGPRRNRRGPIRSRLVRSLARARVGNGSRGKYSEVPRIVPRATIFRLSRAPRGRIYSKVGRLKD